MTAVFIAGILIYQFDQPWWWILIAISIAYAEMQLATDRHKHLYEMVLRRSEELKHRIQELEQQIRDLRNSR